MVNAQGKLRTTMAKEGLNRKLPLSSIRKQLVGCYDWSMTKRLDLESFANLALKEKKQDKMAREHK